MNPKVRQTAYLVGTIATGAVTLLSIWHGISGDTATALTNAITALCGLLGVGATATATAVVAKQRKDGTFDNPALSTAEQAINGMTATVQQAQVAADDVARLKRAAAEVLRSVPVVGPLTQQVIDSVTSQRER